jgi:hypothetical protein
VGFTTQGDGEATRVVISKVRMPPILLDPRAADGANDAMIPSVGLLLRCLTEHGARPAIAGMVWYRE